MTEIRYYKVGGFVRDTFLGLQSKDIDYSVEAPSYDAMADDIRARGGMIFLEKPEFLTIRAKFGKEVSDYVLCRKEGAYRDGRHPDTVELGDIFDDLARRDFTMNAIAMRTDGTFLDPHGGVRDIENKLIRCVGNARERLNEDPLRMLRAIRFAITKGFRLDDTVKVVLGDHVMAQRLETVSIERVCEEINRCLAHSTVDTLSLLARFPHLKFKILTLPRLSLEATLRERS